MILKDSEIQYLDKLEEKYIKLISKLHKTRNYIIDEYKDEEYIELSKNLNVKFINNNIESIKHSIFDANCAFFDQVLKYLEKTYNVRLNIISESCIPLRVRTMLEQNIIPIYSWKTFYKNYLNKDYTKIALSQITNSIFSSQCAIEPSLKSNYIYISRFISYSTTFNVIKTYPSEENLINLGKLLNYFHFGTFNFDNDYPDIIKDIISNTKINCYINIPYEKVPKIKLNKKGTLEIVFSSRENSKQFYEIIKDII